LDTAVPDIRNRATTTTTITTTTTTSRTHHFTFGVGAVSAEPPCSEAPFVVNSEPGLLKTKTGLIQKVVNNA
jgi:hypothetical protein